MTSHSAAAGTPKSLETEQRCTAAVCEACDNEIFMDTDQYSLSSLHRSESSSISQTSAEVPERTTHISSMEQQLPTSLNWPAEALELPEGTGHSTVAADDPDGDGQSDEELSLNGGIGAYIPSASSSGVLRPDCQLRGSVMNRYIYVS